MKSVSDSVFAADYPWSSYHANALGQRDPLITPYAAMLALERSAEARATAYRALFSEALSDEAVSEIRVYLQQQRALGTNRSRARVEAELQRFASVRPAHRPRKSAQGAEA